MKEYLKYKIDNITLKIPLNNKKSTPFIKIKFKNKRIYARPNVYLEDYFYKNATLYHCIIQDGIKKCRLVRKGKVNYIDYDFVRKNSIISSIKRLSFDRNGIRILS